MHPSPTPTPTGLFLSRQSQSHGQGAFPSKSSSLYLWQAQRRPGQAFPLDNATCPGRRGAAGISAPITFQRRATVATTECLQWFREQSRLGGSRGRGILENGEVSRRLGGAFLCLPPSSLPSSRLSRVRLWAHEAANFLWHMSEEPHRRCPFCFCGAWGLHSLGHSLGEIMQSKKVNYRASSG